MEERDRLLLDRFFARAAWAGERGVARARLALACIVLLELVVEDHAGLLRGELKYLARLGIYGSAVALSVLTLRREIPPGGAPSRLPFVSVAFDPLMIGATLFLWMLWPTDPFYGFLASFATGALLISTVASGARVDVRVTVFGVAVNGVVFAALLVAERFFPHAPLAYGNPGVAIASAIFIATGLLSVGIARSARKMVIQAVEATLSADRAHAGLSSYLSPAIADDIIARAVTPGVKRCQLAVLFTDLRGFTAYAEKVEPERLVEEMNAYFEEMIAAVHDEGGMVDKYVGDAIMAVFGAPPSQGDDAARAIRAAFGMRTRLAAHNARRAARQLPPLVQGVGIHYGSAVAGNIGTLRKLQYTVMGDVVNVASRLESATKTHREEVFISDQAVEAASGAVGLPALRRYGEVVLPGRENPIGVHTFASDGELVREPRT